MGRRSATPSVREDPRMPPDTARLAVLIDSDNTTATLTTELLEEIAKFGTPTVKRAYGDWTTPRLAGGLRHLRSSGSTGIYRKSTGGEQGGELSDLPAEGASLHALHAHHLRCRRMPRSPRRALRAGRAGARRHRDGLERVRLDGDRRHRRAAAAFGRAELRDGAGRRL